MQCHLEGKDSEGLSLALAGGRAWRGALREVGGLPEVRQGCGWHFKRAARLFLSLVGPHWDRYLCLFGAVSLDGGNRPLRPSWVDAQSLKLASHPASLRKGLQHKRIGAEPPRDGPGVRLLCSSLPGGVGRTRDSRLASRGGTGEGMSLP